MDSFFVDKLGNVCGDDFNEEGENTIQSASDEEDGCLNIQEIDLFDEPLLDSVIYSEAKAKRKDDFNLNNTYFVTHYKNMSEEIKDLYLNVDKILEKSSLKPGLEKQHMIQPEKSKELLKLERKKQSKKTKGKQWFDMPATELTKEISNDFKLLKMRSVLDRKHVYKKNDITNMPKYFQVGKVIESPADFYGGRIPKLQRKQTFVDELLADAEFKKYQKKKFKEIMHENGRKKQTKKNMLQNKNYKSKVKSKNKHN